MRHRTLVALVLAMLTVPATAALAQDERTDTARQAIDRPVDERTVDTRPDSRPDDLRRCLALDRPVDCCRFVAADVVTDRCDHDRVNLRALLRRAIQAHEWQLVVRILHALGII